MNLLNQQSDQDSAERLRVALNAAQMGMWDWDMITGSITWSPEHEMLFGLPLDSFDGRYETFDERLHPDDRAGLNQAVAHSLQNQMPYHHEYRIIWADGSIHWVEGRGRAFYNEAGQPVRMSGTIMAIDERKQAQILLQQQLEQQRLIMEITQRIRQSLNLEEILQTTVDEVRQFLQVDRVIVFQFAPGWGGAVTVESVRDKTFSILPFNIYDPCIGSSYVGLFQQGLVTAKADIYTADISPCHVEFLAQFHVRANLVVPILKNNELWGLLAVHHCAAPREWQDAEIDLLRQIAAQVSIAVQQSALFEQVQTELRDRQQAEAALKQQESLLRLFAQYAPAGIAMFDQDMRYVMTSQRWVDEYQLGDVDSVIGRSHYDIFPEIPDHWRQVHQRCLAGAIEQRDDDLFVRADGTVQWISWEIRPWYTATGKIGGIIIFSIDITPKKQTEIALQQLNTELEQRVAERTAELTALSDRLLAAYKEQAHTQEALRESEERRRLALDLTRIGFWDWHLPSGQLIWNDNHYTLLGLTPNSCEPTYELWRSCIHPDDLSWVEQRFGDSLKHQTDYTAEYRVIHLDGSTHWLMARAKAIYNDSGEAVRSLGVLLDISDRKQVEAALQIELQERQQTEAVLREAERRWRSLLDNVQLIVVGLDQLGRVNYVNPFFLHLIGYRDSEVLGENWFENFVPASHQQAIQVAFSEELADNTHPYYRNSILTKSGEERFIDWNNTILQDFDGRFIGTISIGEDVTERQKVERMKNEFIGIVSHELRTPLTAIQMSLGLLNMGVYANKPEKSQRMIEIALTDTNRLVNLVNDILDLERLESGQTVLEKTVCQAVDLMQQAVEGVQAIAAQQHITLTLTPTDAIVWAAPDTLVQTLTNLLSNAIKFSPTHSVITLRVDRQRDNVLFQIIDQGRGIPEDKLESIFGRFQQVDASDSREKGGTGLGLSICRSIIERHSGKIWAESTLGEGSTFLFTLPFPPNGLYE